MAKKLLFIQHNFGDLSVFQKQVIDMLACFNQDERYEIYIFHRHTIKNYTSNNIKAIKLTGNYFQRLLKLLTSHYKIKFDFIIYRSPLDWSHLFVFLLLC